MKKSDVKKVIRLETLKIFQDGLDNLHLKKFLWFKILVCKIMNNVRYDKFVLIKSYRWFNYYENVDSNIFKKIYWGRLYGKFSKKLNCQINIDNLGAGFYFGHNNIVINKGAIIGKNLKLIGNNCIGGTEHGCPKIGDNVTLGYGAMIIGNVFIANNVFIGAGAIVTKDILQENTVVIGLNKILKK